MAMSCVARRLPRAGPRIAALALAGVAALASACGGEHGRRSGDAPTASAQLRIGVAQLSTTSPINGLRQLTPIFTLEGLARAGEDGRIQPELAESWATTNNGRSLIVKLRSNVRFHDGS